MFAAGSESGEVRFISAKGSWNLGREVICVGVEGVFVMTGKGEEETEEVELVFS
jgi:hypothetical protein